VCTGEMTRKWQPSRQMKRGREPLSQKSGGDGIITSAALWAGNHLEKFFSGLPGLGAGPDS
jgi:hypothetical protein